jgi:Mycothiol maleylpyruvate isomerase N-terminal domain
MRVESSVNDGPRTPRELIERTEQSWRAWVDAVEGIPEERLAEPMVGHWSTKDLLGHIAFWEDWVIGDCQRILAGEPDPGGDMDAVNQGQVEESKHAPAADQKRYRDEAHGRLAAFLATIPEDSPHFPDLVKALAWETYEHYDEHAAEVRAWREAEGI